MWDYDKLFANNNVVGIKVLSSNNIYNYVVDSRQPLNNIWSYYKNSDLKDKDDSNLEIQYIIRLDDRGQVAEWLFDREKDMPKPMPELESGMFVTVFWRNSSGNGVNLGYVDKENNHIIYLSGGYDNLNANWDKNYRIVEVYRKNTRGFKYCTEQNLLWREPNYIHKTFDIEEDL